MKIDKFRLLVILTIGLLILNLGTLSFLFLQKKGGHSRPHNGHHKKKPETVIIKHLQFDDNQQKEYKALVQVHRKGIKILEEERKGLKDELFRSLNSTDSLLEEQHISKLAEIQREIETLHLKHLKAIKALCTADQMNEFEKLSKHLGRIFHPHPKGRRQNLH